MKNIIKHTVGYAIGFIAFVVLIPFGLYKLSIIDFFIFNAGLFDSIIVRLILSVPIFIVGVVFAVWSNIFLLAIGKGGPVEAFNISVSPKTKKLVTIGPYRYSRNPMVFGTICLYTSLSIFFNSILCLICVLFFLFLLILLLKFSEEKRLLKDFGDEYKEYKQKVSMMIPIIRLKK